MIRICKAVARENAREEGGSDHVMRRVTALAGYMLLSTNLTSFSFSVSCFLFSPYLSSFFHHSTSLPL
jgi:hypothetical protein